MTFERLNLNPKNRKTSDCVIRAISYAFGQSWEDTFQDLCKIGLELKSMPNDKLVYSAYLADQEWAKQKMPRFADNSRYTIKEFLAENPQGTFILSIANHLTVAKDGVLVDTWNCSHKSVGNYWTNN